MSRARIAATLSLFCSPAFASSGTLAQTVTVRADGGGDFTSIEAAIAATSPDDTILIRVEAGTYPPLTIPRGGRIVIEADGKLDDTTLQGLRVDDAAADVTLSGIEITDGGVQLIGGRLQLSELRISAPGTDGRPAVSAAPGTELVMDTALIEEWTQGDAPIVLDPGSTARLDMVGIMGSRGSRAGAVWSKGADLEIDTLLCIDTDGSFGTGAVHIAGGTASIVDSRFERAIGNVGGGLRISGGATVTASDLTFLDNESPEGAHVRLESGDFTLVRSTASGGSAHRGGVLWQGGGTADIRNADWEDNHALDAGGGIYQAAGTLSVAYATMTRMASSGGAGAYAHTGTATYEGVIIADTEGPALAVASTASVDYVDSIIYGAGAEAAVVGAPVLDPNTTFARPGFVDPSEQDYALRSQSPALDLGVRGELDPDGTAADAGMYGGPDAWLLEDRDGDGYVYGRDCADGDETIHEGAIDTFYDGVDSNCDGRSDFDQDGDGHDASAYAGGDCNDTDATIYPAAVEVGDDAIDADCDGYDFPDADGDGWPADLDCDDAAADIAPDAMDPWYDGIDQDCAGNDDYDQDGDGYISAAHGGRDCDDADAQRHPMYPDFPGDGIDQDCDGQDAIAATEAEDTVTTLTPASEETQLAPAAMGDGPEASSGTVSAGCSVSGAERAGSWALGLLAVLGLIARRRD